MISLGPKPFPQPSDNVTKKRSTEMYILRYGLLLRSLSVLVVAISKKRWYIFS